MRLCIDCRFFTSPNMCSRELILDHETTKSLPITSPVDGTEIPFESSKPTFSALLYRARGNCGMEAKYFEPKK